MLDLANSALEAATKPGVSYADVRVVESRDRSLSTKNGRPGSIMILS